MAVHTLIWITARNRADNGAESLGLWTGADVIETGGRTYYGAGALLDLDPITANLTPREVTWAFRVSPLDPAVIAAVRTYDARLAPVEVYEWFHDPDTTAPLADPVRVFRGNIFTVDMPEPAIGQDAAATITCVSDSWRLTRPLTLVRSDAALQARASGDLFRRYNAVSAVTPWGSHLQ